MSDIDSHYTREHFTRNTIEIAPNLRDHCLRADQFAAVCYAHDIGWDDVRPMLREPRRTAAGDLLVPADSPEDEAGWTRAKVTREEQIDFIMSRRHAPTARRPGSVLSVGGGRGEAELVLAWLGNPVLAIEPATACLRLINANVPHFSHTHAPQPTIFHGTLGGALAEPGLPLANADTVLFIESIEHVPVAETRRLMDVLRDGRARRLIVTNWSDRHPIEPDATGWNHVTRIDDVFYDELSRGGRTAIRHGSHLAVDFGAP